MKKQKRCLRYSCFRESSQVEGNSQNQQKSDGLHVGGVVVVFSGGNDVGVDVKVCCRMMALH